MPLASAKVAAVIFTAHQLFFELFHDAVIGGLRDHVPNALEDSAVFCGFDQDVARQRGDQICQKHRHQEIRSRYGIEGVEFNVAALRIEFRQSVTANESAR